MENKIPLDEIRNADPQVKEAVMLKITEEMRDLYRDIRRNSSEADLLRQVPIEKLSDYYSRIQDALYDLQFDDVTAYDYWEMVDLYKDIFVDFYYDRKNLRIFQRSVDGETYVIGKDNLRGAAWHGRIPEEAVLVTRKYAERTEDNWREEYDIREQAESLRFEDYYLSVKRHLRRLLQVLTDDEVDVLLISNIEYIRGRYQQDMTAVLTGEVTEEVFKQESPAMAAEDMSRRLHI